MSLQILRSIFELGILETLQNKDFKVQTYSQTLLIDWLLQNGFIYKSTQSCYILTAKGQEALRLKNVFYIGLVCPIFMTKESRLYIIESLQDKKKQDIEVKVHLLNFLGGMERSLREHENIVSESGLKIVSVTKFQGIMSVMEIRKE